MPCVLPVLSLKLLSVVSHGGSAPREIRAGFLASAGGILFSFLVLAGAAIALKLTGSAVGWGIQFQQPLFLVFMVVLVTGFAANLWGLFEIPLPRAIADIAVGGHNHDGTHSTSLGGHFATGALATLLATPCSAPFLGQPSASRWRAARWKSSPSSPLSALASPCPICWWQPSRPWHRACRAPAAGCWCCAGCLAARWR